MKKKLASFLMVILVGVLIFTGCGFEALAGGPSSKDPVTSNGGMVVQKGNYLYHINAYIAISDLSKKYNGKLAGIYRTELNADGTIKTDENGNNITQLLASKVVGYENGGLYIFGDKLYYATPNTEKGNDGKVNYEKIDFYVVNLDGTNAKRIYKTEVGSTKTRFAFYEANDTVYLAVYDSSNLCIVDTANNTVNKVATSVSSVVFPRINESNSVAQPSLEGYRHIYYTRSAVEEDDVVRGNIMAMINISTQEEIEVARNATYTVVDFKNDTLIFTKKGLNESYACYYMAKFVVEDNTATVKMSDMERLSYQEYKNSPIILDFEDGYRGMIVKNESGYLTYIKKPQGGLPVSEVLTTEVALTPIAVYDNYIFAYNGDKELYMIKYNDPDHKLIKLTDKDSDTLSFDMNLNIDYANGYVYFYKNYKGESESCYYLVRLDASKLDNFEVELVGKLQNEHIAPEESTEE